MAKNLLFIFAGGGIGSILRYFFASAFNQTFTKFPLGTFLANVISSLIVGIVVGWMAVKENNAEWFRYFVIIGICGGFSTFSGFSNETFSLIKNGNLDYAFLNIIVNVVVCILMIWLGIKFGSAI